MHKFVIGTNIKLNKIYMKNDTAIKYNLVKNLGR